MEDLWTYDLYVDPLSCQIILMADGDTVCLERSIDLTVAIAALPVAAESYVVELVCDTGHMLVMRIDGDVKGTLKFDDTIYYKV